MSFTDEQRKLIGDIVEAELERRSLSPETQAEDTKRRVLDIMEEANDPATFVGTRAHNWLVRNLDLLRPRTDHYVTRFIRATGRVFVHHAQLLSVLGLLVVLVTAGITQMQHLLFAWNKDAIVKKVLEAPKFKQEHKQAMDSRLSEILKLQGQITNVRDQVLREEGAVTDFKNRVGKLNGRLSNSEYRLAYLKTMLDVAMKPENAQPDATASEAVDAAKTQAIKLSKELGQVLKSGEEEQTCHNTTNSLCLEPETCPDGTAETASIRFSSAADESSEYKLCVRDQTGNK